METEGVGSLCGESSADIICAAEFDRGVMLKEECLRWLLFPDWSSKPTAVARNRGGHV